MKVVAFSFPSNQAPPSSPLGGSLFHLSAGFVPVDAGSENRVCGMGMIGGHQEAFKIVLTDFFNNSLMDNATLSDGVLLPDSKRDRYALDIPSMAAVSVTLYRFLFIQFLKCSMFRIVNLRYRIVNKKNVINSLTIKPLSNCDSARKRET